MFKIRFKSKREESIPADYNHNEHESVKMIDQKFGTAGETMSNTIDQSVTPIADTLIQLTEREIVSFHALPVSQGRSLTDSPIRDKYNALFGQEYFKTEVTYSGKVFDSPILPRRIIKESMAMTAKAFGAKSSLYITMGTTMANYIALRSLLKEGDRALVDKTCHQSIHFGMQSNKAEVTYLPGEFVCKGMSRSHFSVTRLIEEYRKAHESGRPFSLVVINGSSYEGVTYDIKRIFRECLEIHDNVSFLVDEAWSAFGFFHPRYRQFSAMQVAAELSEEMPDKNFTVVTSQSAHKSLSCLRQASFIHIYGPQDVVRRFETNKFMMHTTSPSYPILVSLELGRAQIAQEGEGMVDKALLVADSLRERILNDERLSQYALVDDSFIADDMREYVQLDPLRIPVDMSKLGVSPKMFKDFAFHEHGVYINRHTHTAFLINVHLGVRPEHADKLLHAMIDFQQRVLAGDVQNESAEWIQNDLAEYYEVKEKLKNGEVIDSFVIPYPPGVPVLVPGEVSDPSLLHDLQEIEASGVDIIIVKDERMANRETRSVSL